jgi:hypothetical protein
LGAQQTRLLDHADLKLDRSDQSHGPAEGRQVRGEQRELDFADVTSV